MQKIITSIRVFFIYAVLLGLIYPLFIMGIGQVLFPHQANGSLHKSNGKVIGSTLIAQEFTSAKYFHSRFSAVNYNAASSGGSDLAPSNKKLIALTKDRIAQVKLENEWSTSLRLPADMMLSSASGLDPHISWINAMLQLPRVAKARGFSKEKVKTLVRANINRDFIGIWGKSVVNVLRLNLALDEQGGNK